MADFDWVFTEPVPYYQDPTIIDWSQEYPIVGGAPDVDGDFDFDLSFLGQDADPGGDYVAVGDVYTSISLDVTVFGSSDYYFG